MQTSYEGNHITCAKDNYAFNVAQELAVSIKNHGETPRPFLSKLHYMNGLSSFVS